MTMTYTPQVALPDNSVVSYVKYLQAPPWAPAPYTPLSSGYDYSGNNLQTVTASTPAECYSFCAANPSCKMFVTATNASLCWLKSATGS
jgi:hypothetical protein